MSEGNYLTLVYDKEYDYKLLLRIFKECNLMGKINELPIGIYKSQVGVRSDYSLEKVLENISRDIMRRFENLLNGSDTYIFISCSNCSRQGDFELRITYEQQRKGVDHMFHMSTLITNCRENNNTNDIFLDEKYLKHLIYYSVIYEYINHFNFHCRNVIRVNEYNFFKVIQDIVPFELVMCEEKENK